jgi:hypothetical protein
MLTIVVLAILCLVLELYVRHGFLTHSLVMASLKTANKTPKHVGTTTLTM